MLKFRMNLIHADTALIIDYLHMDYFMCTVTMLELSLLKRVTFLLANGGTLKNQTVRFNRMKLVVKGQRLTLERLVYLFLSYRHAHLKVS